MFYRSMKIAFTQNSENFFLVLNIEDDKSMKLEIVKSNVQIPDMVRYVNTVPYSSISFVRSMTKIATDTRRSLGKCFMMNSTTLLQVIDLFDWEFMYFALSQKIDIVIDEDLLPNDVFVTILNRFDSPFGVCNDGVIYLHPDDNNRIIRLSTVDDLKLFG